MNKQLAIIGEVLTDYNSGECSAKDSLVEIQNVLEDKDLSLEDEVWTVIKKYPEELGFVLQERDYNSYLDTFSMSDNVVLTEEQFNLIKEFFQTINKGK